MVLGSFAVIGWMVLGARGLITVRFMFRCQRTSVMLVRLVQSLLD